MPAHPLVFRRDEYHQLLIAQLLQIHLCQRLVVINDLVDSSVAAVVAVLTRIVALVLVVPVDDVNRAVLVVELVERLRPSVVEVQEILSVAAHIAGTAALRDVHVEPLAVDVSDKKFAAIFLRPACAEIAHHAGVGVPAADRVTAGVGRVRTLAAGPVDVVAVLFDVLINERVDWLAAASIAGLFVARGLLAVDAEMFASLAFDTRALDDVPEVRYDAHLREELAVFVEVNAPGVAAALGEDF